MRSALMGLCFGLASATAVWAQETTLGDDFQTGIDQIIVAPLDGNGGLSFEGLQRLPMIADQDFAQDITTETRTVVIAGAGVNLRALDKLTGDVRDLPIAVGQSAVFGRISIYLADCRYPEGNPAGDAFAYLLVTAEGEGAPVFSGWMVASSPALNAMDHARYDIWPLTCSTF